MPIHALEKPNLTKSQKKLNRANQNSNNDIFIYIHCFVKLHWVPKGQTVTQHHYLHTVAEFHEGIGKKRTELWKEKSGVLHQDNTPAHSALSVKHPGLDHQPYSPDRASCEKPFLSIIIYLQHKIVKLTKYPGISQSII